MHNIPEHLLNVPLLLRSERVQIEFIKNGSLAFVETRTDTFFASITIVTNKGVGYGVFVFNKHTKGFIPFIEIEKSVIK